MHVELSDLLTCPRCGPTYGLILLPSESRDRRVESGVLGCANCRERYPVEGGVPDLRIGPGSGAEVSVNAAAGGGSVGVAGEVARDKAMRLAAFLDLTDGGGSVLLAGPSATYASLLSELVPGVTVVVIAGGEAAVGDPAVTRLRVDSGLPFRARGLRGVALTGDWASMVEEGASLLRSPGRLVLDPAPADAGARLAAAGLAVLLDESGVAVGGRGR